MLAEFVLSFVLDVFFSKCRWVFTALALGLALEAAKHLASRLAAAGSRGPVSLGRSRLQGARA